MLGALLTVLLAFAAHAKLSQSECPSVDMAEDFGPVHRQYDYDWCTPTVAADLMSHELGLKGGDRIAVYDVALAALTTSPEKIGDAGLTIKDWPTAKHRGELKSIAEFAQGYNRGIDITERKMYLPATVAAYNFRGGACSERKLPGLSQSFVRVRDEDYDKDENEKQLQEDWKSFVYRRPPGSPSPVRPLWGFTLPQCRKPPVWLNGFEDLRRAANDEAVKQLDEKIEKFCGERTPIPPLAVDTLIFANAKDSNVSFKIAEFLKQKPAKPVAVALDAGLLRRDAVRFYHSAIVVGARWDKTKETCEFEIRNSWGADCEKYASPLNEPGNCKLGNVWIPEEVAQKNIYQIDVIRRVKPAPPAGF